LNYPEKGDTRIMDKKQMLGRRIKELRTRKGFTQEELAERMDIGSKYLSSIERGKENPTLHTLMKLAESLDLELGDVFGFMQVEDPKGRKKRIIELLKEADEDELKVILKVVMAIVR